MLTQELLMEILSYNHETGEFSWKKSPANNVKVGSVAGNVNPVTGYASIKVFKKPIKSHRLAWLYVYGVYPDSCIDHINGNKRDNRIDNLRLASSSENQQNLRRPTAKNTTGYLGVTLNKRTNKYIAMLKYDGKNRHLGVFDSATEASACYLAAKRKHHSFCTI